MKELFFMILKRLLIFATTDSQLIKKTGLTLPSIPISRLKSENVKVNEHSFTTTYRFSFLHFFSSSLRHLFRLEVLFLTETSVTMLLDFYAVTEFFFQVIMTYSLPLRAQV